MIDETMKAELSNAVNQGNGKKVVSTIEKMFKNTKPGERKDLFEIIGQMLTTKADFFNEQVYLKLEKSLKKVPINDLIEMDLYILKTYCLYQGEEIQATVTGTVVENFGQIKIGRIYITPFRIIATGLKKIQTKGLNAAVGMWQAYLIAMDISRKLQMGIAKQFSGGDRATYGSTYPVRGAYKVKRTNSRIQFKNDLQYDDKKGKQKEIKLDLKISPKKSGSQNKNEFQAQVKNAFDLIERSIGSNK